MLFKFLSLAAFAGLTLAAPADNGVRIVVKNQCSSDLQVGHITNGQSAGEFINVKQGTSKSFPFAADWQGRFWARESCNGESCAIAGAANPASLAEFTFKGSGGFDYYDVSFVDGYNLPISIHPISGDGDGAGNTKYACGAPECSKLPHCPDDLKQYEDGKFVGCKSACSAFGTDEYCCAGAHNTPDTCSINSYAQAVKDDCPDVYSFAYDDHTSTYMCKAQGYTVTFCP